MKIIQSTLLKKFTNVTSGFTTKEMGNVAFHVNDIPLDVENTHEALAKELSYNKSTLIHMKQIHSCDVHRVEETDSFTHPHTCDALVTNKRNTPLMVMVADCSPVLFYDNKHHVIAVAHAGRKGAFKNIMRNTIESMRKEFHVLVENIYVSIGPSIGVCCYEVGEEIYEEAIRLNLEDALQKRGNSYYLNIRTILTNQLLHLGIKEENIEISMECTSCLQEKYYSYRAKANTGRFAGVLILQ